GRRSVRLAIPSLSGRHHPGRSWPNGSCRVAPMHRRLDRQLFRTTPALADQPTSSRRHPTHLGLLPRSRAHPQRSRSALMQRSTRYKALLVGTPVAMAILVGGIVLAATQPNTEPESPPPASSISEGPDEEQTDVGVD